MKQRRQSNSTTSSSASFLWSCWSATNCFTRRCTCRAHLLPPRLWRNSPHLTFHLRASDLCPLSDLFQDSWLGSRGETWADGKTIRCASRSVLGVSPIDVLFGDEVDICNVNGLCLFHTYGGHVSCSLNVFVGLFLCHVGDLKTAQRPQRAHFLWTDPPSSFIPHVVLAHFYLFMAFFLILFNVFLALWGPHLWQCLYQITLSFLTWMFR